MLTIRMPAATRRRLAALARREGRSLSGQAERLIEQGLTRPAAGGAAPIGLRPLAGILRGGAVPTLEDFREARILVSSALRRGARAQPRR